MYVSFTFYIDIVHKKYKFIFYQVNITISRQNYNRYDYV